MKSFELVSKVKVYAFEDYTETHRQLIEAARKAVNTSYSPYSHYRVGAAVLLENGIIISGSNQENAAYPSGLCAERTALFYANSQYPDVPVKAIAIIACNNEDFTEDVCTPCGSCRQVLAEIETRYGQKIRILMCSKKQVYEVDSVEALLPFSFNKNSLD